MPAEKLNVVDLMDHGIVAPTAITLRGTTSLTPSSPVSPGDSDERVMTAVKRVTFKPDYALLGQVVLASGTPTEVAERMIEGRYQALKGAQGFLGKASGAVTRCPDKVGFFRHYAGGSIYWHPHSGAHEVHGHIRALWASLEWERGFLGYPRTDETVGRDAAGKGRYNHFTGGSIYWHPDTGAHEVHGAIRTKYLELGAEASFLGYPTTHETKTPDGVGRFNHFQGGSIYWTPRTWAHEVHGLIRGFWAQHGWERNADLGYPISDERVPDRGIGHGNGIRVTLPVGTLTGLAVVGVPAEQPSPLLTTVKPVEVSAADIIATKKTTATAVTRTRAATAAATRTSAKTTTKTATKKTAKKTTLTAIKAVDVRPELVVAGRPILINPALLPRDHTGPSRDRYSDFENGVLFWRYGAAQAEKIAPRSKGPKNTKTAWTGAEIAALWAPRLRNALKNFPGASVQGVVFSGVTDYSWDGAGVHNREHRLRVTLAGKRRSGNALVNTTSVVEVRVEISFDPVDREVCGFTTGWFLSVHGGDFHNGGDLRRALHQRLDPELWKHVAVTQIPGSREDPIAVLSVKTLSNGNVAVYFEP